MKIYLIIALMLLSNAVFAGWTLCNQASNLNFVTTVDGNESEVHSFSNMTGSITDEGIATLKIDLASVETNNSERNNQIRTLIFDTENFQEMEVRIVLEPDQMAKISRDTLPFPISVHTSIVIHGVGKEIKSNLLVTRLQTGCLLVSTMKPVILSLADFNLLNNLDKLRSIANLKSIAKTVSVTFSLFYKKDEN